VHARVEATEGLDEFNVAAVPLDEGRSTGNIFAPATYEAVERDNLVTLIEQELGGS
jgi:hypothetical protein